MDDDSPWLVVRSKPRMEKSSAEALTAQGREVYLPLCENPKFGLHAPVPLFRSYLFVRDVGDFDRVSLRYTRGVSGILRAGREGPFLRMRADILTEMRSHELNGLLQVTAPDEDDLKRGDKVLLVLPSKYGTDSEIIGEVLRLRPGDRVEVMFWLLGASRRVVVHRHQIREKQDAAQDQH